MMKRAIIIGLIGLVAALYSAGCAKMLDPQAAKDRDLGVLVEQNLKTSDDSRPYFVSLKFDGQPGVYRCVTKDLPDGQTAGKFAYNAMVRLKERNDSKVQTGRDAFRIIGVQGVQEIFQVTCTSGPGNYPQVTLEGPWSGETYTPKF